jgi:hypothetical protein
MSGRDDLSAGGMMLGHKPDGFGLLDGGVVGVL